MWARHLLFLGVCLTGAWLVGDNLLRRDRVADPKSARPDRFAGSESTGPWPDSSQPGKDWRKPCPSSTPSSASTGPIRGCRLLRGPII